MVIIMKYVYQVMIIWGISMVAEFLNYLLPFVIPASVYGLAILFLLLVTKIIKVEQVEGVSKYLMAIMPIFFIDSAVELMDSFEVIKGKILILFIACILSFVAMLAVTGVSAQFLIEKMGSKKGKK